MTVSGPLHLSFTYETRAFESHLPAQSSWGLHYQRMLLYLARLGWKAGKRETCQTGCLGGNSLWSHSFNAMAIRFYNKLVFSFLRSITGPLPEPHYAATIWLLYSLHISHCYRQLQTHSKHQDLFQWFTEKVHVLKVNLMSHVSTGNNPNILISLLCNGDQ